MTSLTPWLSCPKPNPQARLRLFCFPYAGAGASIFRPWSNTLPSSIEVCCAQLPGREKRWREKPLSELSPLIQTLAQVLLPYLDKPFAFFGHSVGALVSFELARQLRRQNSPSPLHLFVSGRRAPQIAHLNSPIHQLPTSAFVEELRRYNGTPEAVLQSPELMQLLLPVLRADLALDEVYTYISEPPLDCSISAFGGLQDKKANYQDLEAWREQSLRKFTLRTFIGDHFFIKPNNERILQAILEDLSQP
ncbi:thioesterase [Candidatus Gracilibacteria bacterium]|nr:thioesterase [Candidatus Gracilibacteria bacterium]NJM89896.1 thioesterase [Hydrococcus sp. RU_2_2]NJP21247.1 thioesterase [Hydrococcus sp. CRU_1_1]